MQEIYAIVSGRVQGVAYRYFAQDAATQLGVTGYVKNLADGRVEVVGHAEGETLKQFIEYLYEGSVQAQVDSVAVEWRDPKGVFTEFSITHE